MYLSKLTFQDMCLEVYLRVLPNRGLWTSSTDITWEFLESKGSMSQSRPAVSLLNICQAILTFHLLDC